LAFSTKVGDILDLHHGGEPNLYFYDGSRATVQGEYGGIGLAVEGPLWNPEYLNEVFKKFKTSEELTAEYVRLAEILKKLVKAGFSAAVYIQITDVENELNGLITYDRKVVKVDEERVRKVNQEVISTVPIGLMVE